MHFYRRIRDIREDSDLTQEDVAAALKITRQQYQLYESGKREFKTYQIIELSKFYNVSSDYLLGLSDKPKKLNISKTQK